MQLRRREDQFQRLGAQVVLVGLGTPEETADFKEQFQVPFPMVSDSEKRLFRDFDLKQMSPSSMLSVGLAIKGFMTMAKGHHMGVPKGDVLQLPGVFIIDTAGRIRYSHYARDPSDHPDPDSLLNVLQSDADLGAPPKPETE